MQLHPQADLYQGDAEEMRHFQYGDTEVLSGADHPGFLIESEKEGDSEPD